MVVDGAKHIRIFKYSFLGGSTISYNVLRIKEVAEGNLGEVKRSILSAVVRVR